MVATSVILFNDNISTEELNMTTTCKTRQDSISGKRDKPHYYLNSKNGRFFLPAYQTPMSVKELTRVIKFEDRIDWSTWGPSR